MLGEDPGDGRSDAPADSGDDGGLVLHGVAWDWSPDAVVLAVDGGPALESRAARPLDGIDPTRALARTEAGPSRSMIDPPLDEGQAL